LPLVANMVEKGRTPLLTPSELFDLGYRLVASPLSLLFAATRAMRDVCDVLQRDGTTRDELQLLVPFDDFGRVVDLDGHYSTEARYRS
jgi:2-methylisocitrate lyase-like PEP mutase family enzyme